MLVSLNWLGRYVDLHDLAADRIADDLTIATAEVEDVVHAGEELVDIVVGNVVACERHPGADKLSLTKVDDGSGELLPVVCGAPNVAAGQRIALCRVGGRLPADGSRLKKTKIRGEISLGMICSERELGLSDAHAGILVLDTDAAAGTPLTDVLPVRDTLIEIDNKSITHRPDLWGHYGFARELAAHYNRPLRPYLEGLAVPIPGEGETLPIDIVTPPGRCPRYSGLVFRDVRVQPAPGWMRYLLLAIGQRPINNIVDLTNFILHDLGQPMHAFDLRRLAGPAIVVRQARDGEVLRTLDGQDRQLTTSDLLICDAAAPVALAGVMGGEGTMVEPDTEAVFLETASFDAATIRRTSSRLGLRTDSSAHFEKSLDPAWVTSGAEKFAALMQEVAPGSRAVGPLHDPSHWRFPGRRILLRTDRASRLLGVPLDGPRVRAYLEPLGFELHETREGFDVDVPSWRATKDIEIEEDLVEELGRRHRYDRIEPCAPVAPVEPPHRDPELALLQCARSCLARDCGYFEAYNYTFLGDELAARLDLADLPYVRVVNAIASHLTRVRRDVLPSLLGSLPDNLRQQETVALCEIGKGYRKEQPGEVRTVGDRVVGRLPHEVRQAVAVLADRRRGVEHPYAASRGHLELLLARIGRPHLPARRLTPAEAGAVPWMHPGRTAVFCDPADEGRMVAYVGELHPKIPTALGLELPPEGGGVAAFCLDLRAVLRVEEAPIRYEAAPKFPPQPVDLAFLVDETRSVAELTALCRAANPKLVREVKLFEVYRGQGLPAGKKSLNFTVTLVSDARTLTTDDEEKYIRRVRELASEAGAELRG